MSSNQSAQSDGYKWVMLLVYVLMALGIWTSWFAQAPLLHVYWGTVFHIGEAQGNLLLSLPGLVAIFLAVVTGRWIDSVGVRKMMILSGILASIGFGIRPFIPANFAGQAVLTVIAGYGLCILTASLPVTMIHWFGHEKAHTYIGIGAGSFFVGGGLGILISALLYGPPTTNVTAAIASAQHVLTIWAIFMVAVTILWIMLARDKVIAAAHERAAFGAEFKKVMQTGSSWLMIIYAIFIGGITVCAMGLLPGQMIVLHGLQPPKAGTVAGLYAIAMGVGLGILPAFAGAVGKKRISVILCAITTIVWIVYMVIPTWGGASLFIFAVVFGFFFEAPWATGLALMESLPGVTPANVGVAAGVYTMATNIGVFGLPIVMGVIMDSAGGQFKPSGNVAGMWWVLIGYAIGLLAMIVVSEKAAPAKA